MMLSEQELKDLIAKVILEVNSEEASGGPSKQTTVIHEDKPQEAPIDDANLTDITKNSMQETFFVPEPENKEQYMKFKAKTPARLGIWRAGYRFNTESLLRFRADHAVAQDAVFSSVP